ncbi:MAG: family protein phosphatase [Burkholderiales bacterium]|jgi:protein phosphatase
MANNVALELASRTDTGRIRSKNEDAIAVSGMYGIAILADGMGGYSAGEVASRIATDVIRESLEEGLDRLESQLQDLLTTRGRQLQNLMVESIQRANSAVIEAARVQPEYQGMGTTLVTALFHEDKVIIAHVGDSRAYRFRQGELTQITRDHSLLQEQIDAGLISPEWARFSQNKNLVTRALGVDAEMEVEIHDHQTEPEEVYLLCSDGLSDMLTDEEMRDILLMHGASLQGACDALVQKANQNGGHDNISAILVKVQSHTPGSSSLLGRLLNWLT